MTEERREGEGKKAPLGERVGRRSAATIEPREMDSTAKDFLLYLHQSLSHSYLCNIWAENYMASD